MDFAALIEWFKELYARRTLTPTAPEDLSKDYRVVWSEIYAKMKELGSEEGIVDARHTWQKLYELSLKRWVNKINR